MDPRDIPEDRMEPHERDASIVEVMNRASDDAVNDYMDATAATRGRNGTANPDVFDEESNYGMGNVDDQGENSPVNAGSENVQGENVRMQDENGSHTDSDDDDSDDYYAKRITYYQQPEPALGSDEYILELIIEVGEYPYHDAIQYANPHDDEDDGEEQTPLERLVFNERMYRRLREMVHGNIRREQY